MAFIDESGQEGGRGKGGSSDFFIISAVVVRREGQRAALTSAFSAAANAMGNGPGYRLRKYSKEPNRNKRHCYITHIANAACQHTTIIAHKDGFNKDRMLTEHGKLYFFVSQLLLERISWICRDAHHRRAAVGQKAFMVFSQRTSLNYSAFRDYAEQIKNGQSKYPSNAEWDYIDLNGINAHPHSSGCDGLLAADYIASAYGDALGRNRFGLTDDLHVRKLARNCYRPGNGRCWRNGLKVFPQESEDSLPETDERLWWLKNYYAWEKKRVQA